MSARQHLSVVARLVVLVCSLPAAALPADRFFSEPGLTTAALSPDGQRVAAITSRDEQPAIVVVDVASGRQQHLVDHLALSAEEASLHSLAWIDAETVAAQLVELRRGVENLLDTRSTRRLVLITLPSDGSAPRVASVRTSGVLVAALPGVAGEFLYARSGRTSRVYRLSVDKLAADGEKLGKLTRIDGGQFVSSNAVAQVEGFALHWFMERGERPSSALRVDENGMTLTALDGDDTQRDIRNWEATQFVEENDDTLLIPIGAAAGTDRFYAVDIHETVRRSVYLVDYQTDDVTKVYSSNEHEIFDVVVAEDSSNFVGVRELRNGRLVRVFIDGEGERHRFGDDLIATEQRIVIGEDQAGLRQLVYLEAHNAPGRFQVTEGNTVVRNVGSVYPDLDGRLTATLEEGSVTVDDLTVPFLLTLPGSGTPRPAPLLVLPHGGPVGVFDTPAYDPSTQFLAANGYAVLRVNFRGSGGYGTPYQEAGKLEYGDGMIRDIHAAVQDVIERPDIDGQRVALVGFSYGGYASGLLALRHPELYRAAVTVAGISDLGLFIGQSDWPEREQRWALDYVGDVWKDPATLAGLSPALLAQDLAIPLLIIHGEKDEIVDIEHAYRLKRMLDRHGKPYDWHVYPDGTHDLATFANQSDMHSRVLSFLQTHLGGR